MKTDYQDVDFDDFVVGIGGFVAIVHKDLDYLDVAMANRNKEKEEIEKLIEHDRQRIRYKAPVRRINTN